MGKLTLKNNLSPETREKLMKLKGEAILLQNGKAELAQKQDELEIMNKKYDSTGK